MQGEMKLYNKEEMLHICEKYGIKTVKKVGAPLYQDKEMADDFSFEKIMREPCSLENEDAVKSSEKAFLQSDW